jgi:enoyl-CoA hydratase/carnithine racemase
MNSYELIEVEKNEELDLLTVYLNNPKYNMFTNQMHMELIDFFNSLRNRPEIRFVILSARGDNFTVGLDLNQFQEALAAENGAEVARLQQLNGQELLRSIEALEQVTIAALRGAVVGGGATMSTSCDFRIMSETAFLAVPETSVGFYYTWGSTPRLAEMVGVSKAMEIIMTGEHVTADEAYRLGLANKVVPDDELMKTAVGLVEKISVRAPTSIRMTKKLAIGSAMRGIGNMFVPETELVESLVYKGESGEGMLSFLEKRLPNYKK